MNPDLPLNRLTREFQRLFLTAPSATPDALEPVRALVLELTGASAWQPLAAVWRGVQTDLDLPAPAIAVNGSDGMQLWFSLAAAMESSQGLAWLEGLRQRYLADVPRHRVTMQATAVPARVPMASGGSATADNRWSAFVAPDLAPIFEETPWLDLPPTDEGQAELLSRVSSITPAELQAALQQLRPSEPAVSDRVLPSLAAVGGAAVSATPGPAHHPEAAEFLLQLMRDPTAPLALRVEAAKALLLYAP